MDADFKDIPYYTKVRWLSRGTTLKRMFELKDAIQAFMKGKENSIAEFNKPEWIEGFAFLVDVTTHLNQLKSQLQEKRQLIHSLFDHDNAFVTKLALWKTQITNQNFIHFPTLKIICSLLQAKQLVITQEKDDGVKITLSYLLQQNVSVELHNDLNLEANFLQLDKAGAAN